MERGERMLLAARQDQHEGEHAQGQHPDSSFMRVDYR